MNWVKENGLRPIAPRFQDERRIGFQNLYLFRFSFPHDATDEQIFKATHDNLMAVEDYDYPTYSDKF